jgi:protein-tyrosine phosphatase
MRNNVFMIADYIHEMCGSDFYLVNLHEKSYDYSLFDNHVLDFQFPDHCAPRLSFVETVAKAMADVKQRIPDVTFFVHCRAGRGRSALITAGYLLFTREADTHDIAIDLINAGRSPVSRMAMTMASQHRYLHYFELYCRNGVAPSRRLQLLALDLLPGLNKEMECSIVVGVPFVDPFGPRKEFDGTRIEFDNIIVEKEFCLVLYNKGQRADCVRCQLHTDYLIQGVERVSVRDDGINVARFEKLEMDGPHHRKYGKAFPDAFAVELLFRPIPLDIS